MASIVGRTVAEEQSAEADDERSLVEAAKHDSAALAKLYRQNYSAIAGYVHRRVADQDEANGIVSDVFIEMVRGIKRLYSDNHFYRQRQLKLPVCESWQAA